MKAQLLRPGLKDTIYSCYFCPSGWRMLFTQSSLQRSSHPGLLPRRAGRRWPKGGRPQTMGFNTLEGLGWFGGTFIWKSIHIHNIHIPLWIVIIHHKSASTSPKKLTHQPEDFKGSICPAYPIQSHETWIMSINYKKKHEHPHRTSIAPYIGKIHHPISILYTNHQWYKL
jgi:hypothetical protein